MSEGEGERGGEGGSPPGKFIIHGWVAAARAPLDISREKKKEKRNHRHCPTPILHARRNFILCSGSPLLYIYSPPSYPQIQGYGYLPIPGGMGGIHLTINRYSPLPDHAQVSRGAISHP